MLLDVVDISTMGSPSDELFSYRRGGSGDNMKRSRSPDISTISVTHVKPNHGETRGDVRLSRTTKSHAAIRLPPKIPPIEIFVLSRVKYPLEGISCHMYGQKRILWRASDAPVTHEV